MANRNNRIIYRTCPARKKVSLTVSEWMTIWSTEYLGGTKPLTIASYQGIINNHIIPHIGSIKLDKLNPHNIQRFYNLLEHPSNGQKGLSPKTIKNVHGILHKALKQATKNGLIPLNPAESCTLPRIVKKEIVPFDEVQTKAFLLAIQGHKFEDLFLITLFTGLREGEALGLKWDCVNLERGTLIINKQLQKEKRKGGAYIFAPLKNDRPRTLHAAPFVIHRLKEIKSRQNELKQQAGPLWEDSGLVFTDSLGHHLAIHTVYTSFKKVAASIGRPDARFHDLRHSYAVASIQSGDDIKTVQGNLGHATASFTLDVYGHVTEQMKQASAERMEKYIQYIFNQPN